MKKRKPLERSEAYLRILRRIGMKPASKTPIKLAYFTTDHLRKLCRLLYK